MIITLEDIEWLLVIGFILGVVIVIVGYMDMKKKSGKMVEGVFSFGSLSRSP